MSLPALADRAIVLGARASDWRDAVRLAGDALVDSGCTTAEYTEAMIRMVDDHGPYIVIAPGLALAHARPGPEVRCDGLSVVTLAEPVEFGHAHNDPVRVVIGLAGVAAEGHLEAVAQLANAFNDAAAIPALAAATTRDAVRTILAGGGIA
ncbi:PTS sugar transporter subunit IIA [Microcella sp.]|uniref:PTS sugar transporter subunit IIA n=1 Tax=Microcella sp. TaxID=1913979 RepID=UPI00299F7666|nr:PTS sugar transporter subunit IIA [Microcella sp.]MDX2025106.1 PTS sugar transporter subunit IIA [Microcella sp.]